MEHSDEVFESIPWDRLGTLDRAVDRRRWLLAAAGIVVVGVTAFVVRQMPAGPEPVAAAVVPAVVEEPPPSTVESVPVSEEELWAPTEPPASGRTFTAERFAVELLAKSGISVASVMADESAEAALPGGIAVVAVIRTETGPETIGLTVEIDTDGEVLRWGPLALDPIKVRMPVPGAEPPPDVLADFTRVAGRWGTTLEVLSSGLADDLWWAELLVRLPSGTELPLMVWENS